MDAKLNYNQIIIDASNRFNAIVNECISSKDYHKIASLTCSSMYSCEKDMPKVEEEHPVLGPDFCFNYRGYQFELTPCNCITRKEEIIGITNENFRERFPHGVFTDRYVCWMFGHKDFDGHTKEEYEESKESEEPEYWSPEVYLVNTGWSWGAEFDLNPGAKVDEIILDAIDKFLETFKE